MSGSGLLPCKLSLGTPFRRSQIPAVINSLKVSLFVADLAHPGDNIAGFVNFKHSIGGKWLELLKDTAHP